MEKYNISKQSLSWLRYEVGESYRALFGKHQLLVEVLSPWKQKVSFQRLFGYLQIICEGCSDANKVCCHDG